MSARAPTPLLEALRLYLVGVGAVSLALAAALVLWPLVRPTV